MESLFINREKWIRQKRWKILNFSSWVILVVWNIGWKTSSELMEIKGCLGTVIHIIRENNFELNPIVLHDLTKLRSYWVRRRGTLMLNTSLTSIPPLLLLSSPWFALGFGKADSGPYVGRMWCRLGQSAYSISWTIVIAGMAGDLNWVQQSELLSLYWEWWGKDALSCWALIRKYIATRGSLKLLGVYEESVL